MSYLYEFDMRLRDLFTRRTTVHRPLYEDQENYDIREVSIDEIEELRKLLESGTEITVIKNNE